MRLQSWMSLLILIFQPLINLRLICIDKPPILVVYSKPAKIPNKNWNDGFVAAVTLLQDKYNFKWTTLDELKKGRINLSDFSAILVKSAWNIGFEKHMRKLIPGNVPRALLISGSSLPPRGKDFLFYDVLFFETRWYEQFIAHHPCAIHAFGINTDIMKPPAHEVEKKFDYIMVCEFSLVRVRRHLKFLDKPGVKIAIGGGNAKNGVKTALEAGGVTVLGSVSPQELVKLYHQSRKAYLPCSISGGGDRSVLEARSCGVEVEIEPDNPKLKELLNGPIYDHHYYAQQLDKGIVYLLNQVNR